MSQEFEIILRIRNIDISPQFLYRMLSNSKQVTSGITNRDWWKENILEFGMWSIYGDDSFEVIIYLTSWNVLSELDLNVRLKRICGIQCDITYRMMKEDLPRNIIEFKHYKRERNSMNQNIVIQTENEKCKELYPEV